MRSDELDLFQKYHGEILNGDYLALLYNPKFIKIEGLYLLSAHLLDDSLPHWLANPKYLQVPEKLENTINHVHLDDFIENEEKQYEIGVVLKKRWLETLSLTFPNQQFEINVIPIKNGGWELQMWATRNDNENISY